MNVIDNVTLNKTDQNKWFKNILLFIIPVVTVYLGQLGIQLQADGHMLSLKDFIPGSFVIGGAIVYLQSVLLDYLKKLQG